MWTARHREHLEQHGWVVVEGVIPKDECTLALQEVERAIERAVGPQDWAAGKMPPNKHGIQELGRLAHLPAVRDVRLHFRVAELWREIVAYLVPSEAGKPISSSWDRICYLPRDGKGRPRDRNKHWGHTDVGPHHDDRPDNLGWLPLQGQIQVSPTDDRSAALVVWDRSHLLHGQAFKDLGYERSDQWTAEKPADQRNWHIWDPKVVADWESRGFQRTIVRVPQGGMAFWYSMTAHQSDDGRESPLPRLVVYSCFAPRALVRPQDRKNFWKAIEERRATNHWPALGEMRLFPKLPRFYNADDRARYDRIDAALGDVPRLTFTAEQLDLLPPKPQDAGGAKRQRSIQ